VADRADVVDADRAAEQLDHRRHDLDLDAGRPGQVGQLAHQLGAGAGNGDEQHVGLVAADHLSHRAPVAGDRHAHHLQGALAGVVVEQGDGNVGAGGVAQHGPDGLGGALTGPHDDHAAAVLG
jgi:hypothetical protein